MELGWALKSKIGMDKPNVFRTSEFFMSEGDTLHVSIQYADGSDTVDLDLVAGDSGVIADSTTYRVVDKDGNIYRTVIIGNQEWIVENLRVTKYADDSPILNMQEGEANDWFLPSYDELGAMYTNLKAEGIGDFQNAIYWCSTEFNPSTAYQQNFLNGSWGLNNKSDTKLIRAARSFTGSVDEYEIGDVGPAGGYIFYIDGVTYYEASPTELSETQAWSDVVAASAGASGTVIGTGAANTAAIIAQVTHTDSGAKLCDDYTRGWATITDGAYCWYNNDIANKADYGALYNWYAVDNAAGLVYLERNGVSETDWRVPTKADWLSLTTLLGGNAVAGGKLKSVGYDYFDVPNTGATDEYGFRGRAGGSRSTTGVFTGLRTNGNHHQSDLSTGNYVSRVLFSSFTSLGSTTALNGNGGYSVRLVRDI